jgi:hypothetical protein
MYYLNVVRILTSKSDQDLAKNLSRFKEHLKRHMLKCDSIVPYGYYMVAETSLEGLNHIHAIVIVKHLQEAVNLKMSLATSRLKAYKDDITKIPNETQANYYYAYCNKQFKNASDRIQNVNYIAYDANNQDLFKHLYKMNDYIEPEDIFVDD